MAILILSNTKKQPLHVQVTVGGNEKADMNPFVMDDILLPNDMKEIYFDTLAFYRIRYADSVKAQGNFSDWTTYGSLLQSPSAIPAQHYDESNIRSLIVRFEGKTLPANEWTHDVHILVAVWYAFYNRDEIVVLSMLRKGITEYYQSLVPSEIPSKGYHETLTRFWLILVKEYINRYKPSTVVEALNSVLQSQFSDKSIVFKFYSKDTLFTSFARNNWQEPDLAPLSDLSRLISESALNPLISTRS